MWRTLLIRPPGPGSAMSGDSLHSFICFALTKDLVDDARDRCGGVD